MLNVFYADALTDREKFIFDQIDPAKKTILLVPDQFSLQAEQDALRYCGLAQAGGDSSGRGCDDASSNGGGGSDSSGRALLELMVTDFSALGHKVVKETDGHEPQIIDKYGRHMLLSLLLEGMDDQLTVFRSRRGVASRRISALADQMNTMISELKRYEVSPEKLQEAIDQLKQEEERQGSSYLILKLEDVLQLYRAYEEAIEGVYRDSEDYITYYADRIPNSSLVQGSDVWIYGFDTFTTKNLLVIRRLLETADTVSVVLTYEEDAAGAATAMVRSLTQGGGAGLFRLTRHVMEQLEETAEEAGAEHHRQRIAGTEYRRASIWALNGSPDSQTEAEQPAAAKLSGKIRLVQNSGFYEEAESAAAFIQSLVRDHGYRYGDIAVLCNDMDGRGRQLLRAFDRWDIPAFADQKRKVLHQPVVSFLLSFLEVLTGGIGGSGIIGMIKSGLLGWSTEDEELLENYVTEFRIRGKRWQQEFVWDGEKYTEEELERLNGMRAFLVSVCQEAKTSIGRRNTAEEKIRGLTRFLQEEFQILDKIGQAVERQQELGLMEGAAETAQIWNAICGILDQIVQVIGSKKISNELLRDMITAGLESLEIGLVPVSRDCVLMGTLQRSRPGQVRALVVTGANAGLLPLDMTDEGLLSRREKQKLEEMELEFAGRERIAQMEEQLAIYRIFSLPSERLYVSCSQSAEDGSMLRPSEVFRSLQEWQPEIENDLNNRTPLECVGSEKATVPYLAEALREKAEGGAQVDSADAPGLTDEMCTDEMWAQVLEWYREHDPQQVGRLMRGVRFDNHFEALGDDLADALYRGDQSAINVSASRLEKFSGCPFAHFVQYGLRAEEQRIFEVGGREIGDVYHRCLMEFSRSLEAASMPEETTAGAASASDGTRSEAASEPARPTWDTITEEQCRAKIDAILKTDALGYREGLFASDEYNQFRMSRITEICGDVAWALVQQVRSGRIKRMYFEQPFGKSSQDALTIPAVEVKVGDTKVRIRGIIDRMDVMDAGEGQPEAIRIVDYKTGNNTIRVDDFRSGYRLQLMVYMDAALQAGNDPSQKERAGQVQSDNRERAGQVQPAGVFYFKIHDFNADGDQTAGIPDPKDPGDLRRRMEKYYRMEGVVINDPALIGAMDTRVDGTDKAESTVIPVKYDPKKESYAKTSGGTLLEREEFRQLLEETNRQVERICGEICRGEIAAVPKRETKSDRDGNRISACQYCGFRSICGFDPAIKGCRYEDV